MSRHTRLCALTAVLLAVAIPPASASLRHQRGDLVRLAAQLDAAVPRANSYIYVDPTPAQREAFAAALALLVAGDLKRAAKVADRFNYDVVMYSDMTTKLCHNLLRERSPITLGWGTYIINPNRGARDIILEAPHPKSDALTPVFAAELYRALDAGALLIAGTHRNAAGIGGIADVTRNPNSIFQLAHEQLSLPTTCVIAIHGFALEYHPDYPPAVYSNGTDYPTPLLYDLAGDLTARGIACGVYDGIAWTDLGATYDVQAASTWAIGGEFVHAEYAREVRDDPVARQVVADSFGYVLAPFVGAWHAQ
jgi:hypothetical protein